LDLLSAGAEVVGLELSFPMLLWAGKKLCAHTFQMVLGDIRTLPFREGAFDKTLSVTAIDFIEDARGAVRELFRVTRQGGCIVVANLNSLSPWAVRRKTSAEKGHPIFQHVIFRSPQEMRALAPVDGVVRTAIHFLKDDDPNRAREKEKEGRARGLDTGAFLVACWIKP
jgi:ubiquinone/menaquinone biosynthesis C-methylase UbiE